MRLGKNFKSCIAVDPDASRLRTAYSACAGVQQPAANAEKHFQYENNDETCCTDGEFFISKMQDSFDLLKSRGDKFDVIISSQVIQHVATFSATQVTFLRGFFGRLWSLAPLPPPTHPIPTVSIHFY
jgi:hypothetical protein